VTAPSRTRIAIRFASACALRRSAAPMSSASVPISAIVPATRISLRTSTTPTIAPTVSSAASF
jgi:hypothetical protein